ncbi:MAG: hypothetical protein Q7K29_07050 [Thermoleophilia bacterium]|nr:hypothetical protein [Thermoleophilia bacterium]
MDSEERKKRIEELKTEIKELRSNMPHHSSKPRMEFELLELEDELDELRAQEKED